MYVLSDGQIEHLAEDVLDAYRAFYALEHLRCLDTDALAGWLGLKVVEVDFRDEEILGATSPAGAELPVRVNGRARVKTIDGDTIAVSRALAEAPPARLCRRSGRYNFTLAHETAHQIFFKAFPQHYAAETERGARLLYRRPGAPDAEDHMANRLAAALLMPRSELLRSPYFADRKRSADTRSDPSLARHVADAFGVSLAAMQVRIRQVFGP